MYIQKLLDYVNHLYNNLDEKNNIELELKLLIDPRKTIPKFINNNINLDDSIKISKTIFSNLLLLKIPDTNQTINFINSFSNKLSLIKQLCFIDGVQQKDKKYIYNKETIHSPLYLCYEDNLNIKLSLSSENYVDDNKFNELNDNFDFNLVRFKFRFVFTDIIDNWEIHFTFIKNLNSKEINMIKKYKKQMFESNLNYKNLLSDHEWIWKWSDSIEIEIENVKKNSVSIQDIHNILCFIKKITYSDIINEKNNENMIFKQLLNLLDKKDNISNLTLKKILPSVIEINKKQYFEDILPNITDYFITDKADGIRTLLLFNNGMIYYMNSDKYEKLCSYNQNLYIIDNSIVECEMVNDIFYIFDILLYNDTNTTKLPFTDRLKLFNNFENITESIKIKSFYKLDQNYGKTIREFYNIITSKEYEKNFYSIDGIIFTSGNDNYNNTKYFKWKSINHMSIDFLAKKCPNKLMGIYPYTIKTDMDLYLLFVGIYHKDCQKLGLKKISYYNKLFPISDRIYFPIQFSPSDNRYAYLLWHNKEQDLNNKIIELNYDIDNKEWKLLRIREDRQKDLNNKNYYGNNFKVAEIIWRNYSNPLLMEHLCSSYDELSKDFYFIKRQNNIHDNIRKFNNYVKYEMINRFKSTINKNNYIIDLGSGHGQDLFKYISLNIGKLLLIDINENNLCEIINRKYSYVSNKTIKNTDIEIFISKLDLNDNWKNNINILKSNGIPLIKNETNIIICNFAIHYFSKNHKTINNFINFINSLLSSGGRFIFTCLDGEKVYNLLKENNFNDWGDKTKYNIHANFTGKFTGVDQEIDILLPFSGGVLYKEYLVNLSLIEKLFIKHKFVLESSTSFELYHQQYKNTNNYSSNKLDEMDIKYIKLLTYNIYYKK
jgi:hypothetical protein